MVTSRWYRLHVQQSAHWIGQGIFLKTLGDLRFSMSCQVNEATTNRNTLHFVRFPLRSLPRFALGILTAHIFTRN